MYQKEFEIKFVRTSVCPETPARGQKYIAEQQLKVINRLPEVLSSVTLKNGDIPVEFHFDWNEYIFEAKRSFELESMEMIDALKLIKEREPQDEFIAVRCKVICHEQREDAEGHIVNRRLGHYLEMTMYHIFLAMNFSCPGSFSLHRAFYEVNPEEITRFDACPYTYACALIQACEETYPRIEMLELNVVWDWLTKTVGLAFHQVAKRHIEKSLYTFLEAAIASNYTPSTLLLVSHAIENIYMTPRQGIIEAIKSRSLLVLNQPNSHNKRYRKRFDEFYGLRSSFVHGNQSVFHPATNDLLDDGVDKVQEKIGDALIFGTSIYLASVQQLIKNNAVEFKFQEQVIYCTPE